MMLALLLAAFMGGANAQPGGLIQGNVEACMANLYPYLDPDGVQRVGVEDLLVGLQMFGTGAGGDTDRDGDTDVEDILWVLSQYGVVCGHTGMMAPGSGGPPPPMPTYIQVVIGQSNSHAGNLASGTTQCVNTNDKHEVRCCSDTQRAGYSTWHSCPVWGRSNFGGSTRCVKGATFAEAHAICAADNSRLCTAAELANDCGRNTGCGYNHDLIWSTTACQPSGVFTAIGNPANRGAVRRQGSVQCEPLSANHEVRCCSDVAAPGYSKRGTCPIFAESVFRSLPGGQRCVSNADFSRAYTICQADGGRLCTVREMLMGCTRGTGCGHDADLIWTGTACTPPASHHFAVIGNPTARWAIARQTSAVCAGANDLHEVRCCSDVQLPGYTQGNRAQQRRCDGVWAESQFQNYSCVHNEEWEHASAVCASDGARLCTVAELMKGCAKWTGCQHDSDLIWSDAPCTPAPDHATVQLGRSTSHYNLMATGNSQCASNNEAHEVRCCSDFSIPRYSRRRGCSVWAESNFQNSGVRCTAAKTMEEAAAVCEADGARLCTAAELAADCTAGTGCMHDNDMIWSGDACQPTHMFVAIGNPRNRGAVNRQGAVQCEALTQRHEVRCCSDTANGGYQRRNGCSVWSESSFNNNQFGNGTRGCVHNRDFAAAKAVCVGDGARLCTIQEMLNRCTAGTGCQHDADLIWTGTGCTPPASHHFTVIGSPTVNVATLDGSTAKCSESNELHEVRCCSDRQIPGYSDRFRMCGQRVWAESVFTASSTGGSGGQGLGCLSNQHWEVAEGVCAADGARLCTIGELASGCSRWTGCNHDRDLIWSDTPCTPPPNYMTVAIGRSSSHFAQISTGATKCAMTTEFHEVRCCADRGIPGYTRRSNRGPCRRVWAESVFSRVSLGTSCEHSSDYSEADAVCHADGARLCTAAEVAADCTAGTGCNHDHDLVWTSTPCTPTHLFAAIGNPANRGAVARQGNVQCEPTSALHEVRCCSDRRLGGYQRRNGCSVWSESRFRGNTTGCVHNNNFAAALAVCEGDFGRLCTTAEMLDRCTAGTGCGHDADLIWTGTSCTAPAPYHYAVI
eukprot:COSAG01_NODE_4361_length_5098_cov_2.121024_1_plen_1077_part_10